MKNEEKTKAQLMEKPGATRREAETELSADSSYARSLIEASLDPLVTISPEGKITDVNEATIKVTGVPREMLIGTDFSNYFTAPEKARAVYRQGFEKGFVTDYPLTIRHRDGQLVDVLYNASVYKILGGNVLGVFAAARDVTESKLVMRDFAETKNFLDNILESSTKYSIIGKDLNHRILSWNEGARRNYGYEAEEIIGRDSSILHTPEDIKSGSVDKLLETAYEKGLAEGEFQRVCKDGSRFIASVVVTRRNDAQGNPIGYLLMSNDISEKKLAEEQVLQASQYARSLIEASLDPLVTIGRDGKITDVNNSTKEVTGVPRARLIGSDFADYFTEPSKAKEVYNRVFAEESVRDYPLTLKHTSGRTIDVLYNASVYRDVAGEVVGVFAAAHDVTEQKRTAETIARQNREIMELSTPVIQVWEGIIVAPLIGTLDSDRTQDFMERFLNSIVETKSSVAMVDITGVPTVDTQTAQHLIEAITAAKLLGAHVILTGVRPSIAQTLVHLGIDLSEMETQASLVGGLRIALNKLGLNVTRKDLVKQEKVNAG